MVAAGGATAAGQRGEKESDGRQKLAADTITNRRRRCGGIWEVKRWWWLAVIGGVTRAGTTADEVIRSRSFDRY
uniref:Uncharacterized protein n=1 Tax=Oryza sativa subsp. japonica TaxID=39947 RepID=Q6ZDI2_ORYSJ|nr:hypothetical protein [Oryza sativa Japonica Group]